MAEKLTVVIVALLGGDALVECVGAVRTLCNNILVVRRDGVILDAEGRTIGRAERLDIPAKRKSAVQLATTPLVALLEDTVVPDRGWAAAVESALGESGVVACGGPVRIAGGLPASSKALALTEYGAYSLGRPTEAALMLPGCNFAFHRKTLLEAMGPDGGLVDQIVLERMRNQVGRLAWTPGMAVTFCHANEEGARLATRFNHGRIYASSGDRLGLGRRASAAAKALLLPAVLTMRSLRHAAQARQVSVPILGWAILQHTAWSAGEFVGATLGPSPTGLEQWR